MKKGQAAMEFLMTYGWAILVVLVAIAALAYFGVLSPSRFLPASCTISPGIGCGEFKATTGAANNLQFVLQNGIGSGLNVSALTMTDAAGSACTRVTPAAGEFSLNDGGSQSTVWTCSQMSEGTRFKGTITMTYTKSGEILSHSTIGTLVAKAEA